MSQRTDTLAARLRDEDAALAAFFAAFLPEQWRTPIYTEGTPWTSHDVLAHLVSAERGLTRMIEDVVGGGSGVAADFDYDAFNAVEVAALAGRSPSDLLADFRVARADLIALVEQLADTDLDHHGRHPALGDVTLEAYIKAVYQHAKIHVRDVKRCLA
ncbi:MAG: maleylpyruvate isomerase N-terminal domain-containing protein [Chloroflexi bacterium]|nr:maleylpyruvate isomerase N-terminal domain-containing protein [Chloroflexota bacterium]